MFKGVSPSDCDLIVMGARGHSVMVNVMIGSISRRVVRRSKKPVLVVRIPEETIE